MPGYKKNAIDCTCLRSCIRQSFGFFSFSSPEPTMLLELSIPATGQKDRRLWGWEWLFLAIVKNRLLSRQGSPANIQNFSLKAMYCYTSWVMSVAAQRDTFEFDKAQRNQLPDYRGPLPDIFNCHSGTRPALARVSPRSLHGAVRWATLGARLNLSGNIWVCQLFGHSTRHFYGSHLCKESLT